MVFSSYVFLFLFLPAVLVLYYGAMALAPAGLRGTARVLRTVVLVVASYLFYGWERYWYVSLILISTVIDFGCGAAMGRTERRDEF